MAAPAAFFQPRDPFLKENAPLENLQLLSNPKFAQAAATVCVTREVSQKTPLFKPARASIQNFSMGMLSLFVITPLNLYTFWNTGICMAPKDWQKNFFSVSSSCLSSSLSNLTSDENRVQYLFWTLMASMWGIGTYTALRWFFRDSNEKIRIVHLRKVYSDIADSLSDLAKKPDAETVKKTKAAAAHLLANLPFIQKKLEWAAKIDPQEAALIVHKLHLVAERIHGGAR
jgi:hypothetical protein